MDEPTECLTWTASENQWELVIRSFMEVNFFFFFLKQTKLNYRLLEGAPAAGLWGSVPRALFSLHSLFFSASPAISVGVRCVLMKVWSQSRGAGGGALGPEPASCIRGKWHLLLTLNLSRRHAARQPWEKESFFLLKGAQVEFMEGSEEGSAAWKML